MVTQIQLGNIYQQNGKTVVGGGQSAIDTEGLINALADAKRIPAVQLEDKLKVNDSKLAAIASLKDIMTRFKDAASFLRNPPGVANATSNIFQYRTTNLSTNTGVDAGNYISVTAEPGTNIQGFSIDNIQQLARETKQDTGTFSLPDANASVVGATPVAGMFTAGTFSLRNPTGGADISLTFNEGDSLNTIASKMNVVKDQTGIQATVIKVANGDPNSSYKIVFTATKTGETYGFDLADPGTVTNDPDGVWSELTVSTTQPARNAVFTIDTVTVERESNSVNDLIDGMTFTLRQETPPGTTVAVAVAPDTDIVKTAITNFADVYNEFRVFIAQQSELGDDGLAKESAVLNNNGTLRSIAASIAAEMTSVVAGITGGNPSRFADIGINFTDYAGDTETPLTRNIIQINEEKLNAALASDFEGVRGLFEFSMTSDNPDLIVFSRTNALNATDITLTIDRTNGTYAASYIDKAGVTRTANFTATAIAGTDGITLTGEAGSGLEGLQFIYSSADDAVVNIALSQGIGDRVFNSLQSALNVGGSVESEITGITESSKRFTAEITRIDEQIVRYREQLQVQYAALESALSRANQILQVLDAQVQAQQNG